MTDASVGSPPESSPILSRSPHVGYRASTRRAVLMAQKAGKATGDWRCRRTDDFLPNAAGRLRY